MSSQQEYCVNHRKEIWPKGVRIFTPPDGVAVNDINDWLEYLRDEAITKVAPALPPGTEWLGPYFQQYNPKAGSYSYVFVGVCREGGVGGRGTQILRGQIGPDRSLNLSNGPCKIWWAGDEDPSVFNSRDDSLNTLMERMAEAAWEHHRATAKEATT